METDVAKGKTDASAKYVEPIGRVYLSGNQALVRLPIEQARRDAAAGRNTAGFISGYRGSPLGHLDQDFIAADALLMDRNIRFQAGVNEDLAATAVWGTQQIGFFDAKFDGVFGLWYSKGPGVDRSGDALRHANLWGTAPLGGVIMAVGDDPMSRSSSIQQQSEHTLASMCIPTFNVANVQDIYDFGLIGWELSRHAGVWVAIKGVSDTYESWLAIDVDPERTRVVAPAAPIGPVHTRWPDRSVDQDERMLKLRLPAVLAFVRANRLNKTTHHSTKRRVGIVTCGKAWSDTVEALSDLSLSAEQLDKQGIEIFKVALVWPLEPESLIAFCAGLDQVLVIEESRPILEPQIKDILFNIPVAERPEVLGKVSLEGTRWLPSHGEVSPAIIARVLYQWLAPFCRSREMARWIKYLDDVQSELAKPRDNIIRSPYFCSGCPHNSSTKVPSGSQQLAGIGCHWLVNLMDRETVTYPHMGGEGGNWAGAAHFLKNKHIFANVGDGTWYHSGSMAIRQAVAAGVNITYKILYNDAVAMTGGQPVDGPISVAQITHELFGESIRHIAVVSSAPEKFVTSDFAAGTTLHHRDELEAVQLRFRELAGVSVVIYEQTCATELRRRRGKKIADDPARRVIINERVCEGCGDCSVQSNCLSVQPIETEYGRKRTIDQSACNKDFSCLKGFCPSFVTVEGGELAKPKKPDLSSSILADLPEPSVRSGKKVFGLMVAGIGGTGVVTISNLIGQAAQSEGKVVQALDLTGLAQKFGAVYCHLKISERTEDLHATRLSVGQCDVLIGADIVTSASDDALSRLKLGACTAVVNDHETVTGEFTRNRDFAVPVSAQRKAIQRFCGEGNATFLDATHLAERLTGNTIGANMLLLGYACQRGWLPVGLQSLEAAIEANGVAVRANQEIFALGRLLAHDTEAVTKLVEQSRTAQFSQVSAGTLAAFIDRRRQDLVAYQNDAYAQRYADLVAKVGSLETAIKPGSQELADAVARNFYKLLAYKDEYEVARLYSDGAFAARVREQFSSDVKLKVHLAPPILSKSDPVTGRPIKREYGALMFSAFRLLARLKGLRGTRFDLFGYTKERRLERALIVEYEKTVLTILESLTINNLADAVAFARWPDQVRGFGPVKLIAIEKADAARELLSLSFLKARAVSPVTNALKVEIPTVAT